jgi:hypothetical protein
MAASAFAQESPQRDVFLGETQAHTRWSFDAYLFSNYINSHCNIFFKDRKKVPEIPFSSLDSQAPEDLWAWIDGQRQMEAP